MFRESDPSDADIILCEKLILDLAREFDIRIRDDIKTGSHLVIDGGEPKEKSLDKVLKTTKGVLREMVIIMYDFLRNMDSDDLHKAANILRASQGTKKDVLIAILEFLATRLGKTAIGGRQDRIEAKPKP
ncbi:unnamed protein product [Plutella xylostella]|uniref:(diamondback moth) hypothetical protein n=1 Tax=Plutella xylostella TaxID=51655 RepID=A0A8S4G8A1_PLUXY|nr:unnamed protein product [Plutella xylostella]